MYVLLYSYLFLILIKFRLCLFVKWLMYNVVSHTLTGPCKIFSRAGFFTLASDNLLLGKLEKLINSSDKYISNPYNFIKQNLVVWPHIFNPTICWNNRKFVLYI